VAGAIAAALNAYPTASAVKVEASGSQSTNSAELAGHAVNQLSVKIEPIYGFVE
jgi:hypothetical protein